MKVNDFRFWKSRIESAPDDSTGAFDKFVQDSSSMDQEPRTNYSNGLSVDPERDSFKKISNVLGAYRRYRRGEKNPALNFNQFFELFSTENFAEGGRIGFENGLSAKQKKALTITYPKSNNDLEIKKPGGFNKQSLKNKIASEKRLYNKHTKEVVDAASMETFGTPFSEVKTGTSKDNFVRKINKDVKATGNFMSKKESIAFSRNKRAEREAATKIKLINAIKNGEFLDVEKFAKNNNITVDQLKAQAKQLQKNIYIKRGIERGNESRSTLKWLTDNINETDNVLKTLAKSNLIVNKSGSIGNVMFDAFGRKNLPGTNTPNPNYNLPKLDAIKKNFNEYDILKKYIKDNFNIVTELDHPLDQNTIKTLMNSSVADLTNVNILEKNLNTGFKKTLNNKYFQAVQMGGEKGLKQKRAVEEIAKQFKLNIGSVPDNQFKTGQVGPFEFNKIDKGVGSFETLNIKDEMLKSLRNASTLDTEWGKYIKDNPGVFEDAGIDLKKLKKPRNVANITKNLPEIEKYLNSTVAKGGSKGKAAAKALAILAGSTGAAVADDGSEGTGGMLKDAAIAGGAVGTVATKGGRKLLGNLFNAAGLPASIAFNYFAGIDGESSLDRSILGFELATAPATLAAAKSVTDKIPNKLLKKAAQVATGSTPFFLKAARVAQPVGIATLGGELVNKVIKESEPNYYIDPQTQEPTFYDRENAADVFPSMIDIYDQAFDISKKENISYKEALNKVNRERFDKLKND